MRLKPTRGGFLWTRQDTVRSTGNLPAVPALLSALSGASLLAAMTFAGSYAIGEYRGVPWPDISAMIRLHGAVNALGFGLLGAWSWRLAPSRSLDRVDHEGG